MGWVDDQIKQRKLLDDEVLSDSFAQMAGAVMGGKIYIKLNDNSIQVKNAIDTVLKFYHVKTRDVPENIKDVTEQIEYQLRPNGIMHRTVELKKGWYKDAIGAMLAVKKDSEDEIVALIPTGLSGYSYADPNTGKLIKIDAKNEKMFDKEAMCFYKPFPLKKLTLADIGAYMISNISTADIILLVVSIFIVTLIGRLLPKINNVLFDNVVKQGSLSLLASAAAFLFCVTLSSRFFTIIKTMNSERINTRISIAVESATMARVLSLPASFFKKYSAGELSSRISNVPTLCEMIVSAVMGTGLTSIFSLMYLNSIYEYAPSLATPSLIIILITTVFSIVSTIAKMDNIQKGMLISSKENGMSYAMISGVQKIKLSGAEKRAFSRWGTLFAQGARVNYNPSMFIKANSAIATAITLLGTLVLYAEAIESGVSTANYYSFLTAYGMLSGAFTGLTDIATSVAQIKPILSMIKPIFDEVPEVSENKKIVGKLSGSIEINNVSFKYVDSMPNVVDDMSLRIHSGEYIAIVGKTGCGKSTIVRLLLGFEKPNTGAIYYDGKDMSTIDLKSLRRNIGVVMQEGKLFQGDIFSNITISAPWLTLDDAWEAAEMAGIADDIRRMPMGMNTLVSEGSGGISGGQRQRLMIARAIAPKPKILIFDEATSALDNITQKKVSESLDGLKCTRIVIAHRLSTIKNCDRILCLDSGKIVEQGTYDELIEKKGFFADLVARQRINKET